MQYGEEQCRNVESMMTPRVAVAARSKAAPAPPAPPSTCSPRNVTLLDVATLTKAGAAAGATARPLTTIRCEPVIARPEMLAPGSPASVMSAPAPPRPAIVTAP